MNRFNIGVIGCGYWGPNLIRNFYQMNRSVVSMVADLEQDRLNHMKQLYPSVTTTKDYTDILKDPSIDVVAIATDVHTHFTFGREALYAGKHVFIEKPITSSLQEAQQLVELAKKCNLKLMVGHTFMFTAAVTKMKSIIESGELGDIYYINAQRLNLGLFQQDINVLWDLAPHDISIILYLLNKLPTKVTAQGAAHISPDIEDVALLTLEFENNLIAFIQTSWLDPDKTRKMTIVGSKKMMVYNDVEATNKIWIYDKSVEKPTHYDTYAEFHYSYKYGDIVIPKLKGTEPLRTELSHFLDCIENDTTPLSDGQNGMEVVRILEAAQQSLNQGNKSIFL